MKGEGGLRQMWREACATGMVHTAYGILLDMSSLWDLLENDPESPATENQRVRFKEDLMHILGDSDGEKLNHWRHLWRTDREAFYSQVHSVVENSTSK